MSQGKLAPIEGGGNIAERLEGGAQIDSYDEVVEASIEMGFDSLPDEMLVEIFSYLEHKDKLCSRLVNKRWCEVMTSWSGFQNSVQYSVMKKEALQMLCKSACCCSTVSFYVYGLELENNWIQEFCAWTGVVNNVTSLALCGSGYSWATLKLLITKFSNLEALYVHDRAREDDKSSKEMRMMRDEEVVQEKWAALVKNLRSLRLDLDEYSEDMFAKTLLLFQGLKNLVELEVSNYKYYEFDYNQASYKPSIKSVDTSLCFMISTSRQTLKTLKITREYLKPELLDQIRQLSNLVGINLDGSSDLQLQQHCLASLKKLQNVDLNMTNSVCAYLEEQDFRALLAVLPRTVRSLSLRIMLESLVFDDDFLNSFPDLAHLTAQCYIEAHLTTGNKFEKMRVLHCKTYSVLNWVNACPNLTKLDIHFGEQDNAFCDDVMQAIIKNLKMLRYLRLGGCDGDISDYGVTGISKEYCKVLVETQSWDNPHEVPSEFRTGLPLCSLTGLETLKIISFLNMDITDMGIRLGFDFKKLNSLSMNVNGIFHSPVQSSSGVTDTGLAYLGKMNPDLEHLDLSLGSISTASSIGVNRLLSHLHRIKRHNFTCILDSDYSESMSRAPFHERDAYSESDYDEDSDFY